MKPWLLPFFLSCAVYAQVHPLHELIDAARTRSPKLKNLIAGGLPALYGRDGAAVWGQEFLFAVESEKPASLSVDKQPAVPMTKPHRTGGPVPLDPRRRTGCPTASSLRS
jgi:hypothetical protein